MRKDLIQIVCCPADKAKLELEGAQVDDHGDVVSGTLRCTECGFGYPVEDGIPNLLPPEYHVGNVTSKGKTGSGTGKGDKTRKAAGKPAAGPGGAGDTAADALEDTPNAPVEGGDEAQSDNVASGAATG